MKINNWLMNIAIKISENRSIKSIKNGLISMMPIMLIGSFCVLFLNLPIPSYKAFMAETFGESWNQIALSIYDGTFSVMSLGILFSVSYTLTADSDLARKGLINPIIVALISFGCLITITNTAGASILFSVSGAVGLFVAIITALISNFLFFFFYKNKLFKVKLFTDAADSLLVQSLSSLEPALFTLLIFGIFKFILFKLGVTDIHAYVYEILRTIFFGWKSSFFSAIIFNVASHVFWFFGLHGNNVLENISQDLWVPKLAENIAAVNANMMPAEIFPKQFFDVFVYIGGSGATLCLIAALLISSRKTNASKLTKLSIPLGLFNINETIIYGLPIVFNPFYLIPFILVPCVLTFVSFCAFYFGLVPFITSDIMWTTPPFLGGFFATKSLAGGFLQIINFAIGTAIYMPFVKMYESYKELTNKKVLTELFQAIDYVDLNKHASLLSRNDDIGMLAKVLASDMENDIAGRKGIFLEYQPQIDRDGKVMGCEALVRWEHYKFGRIPPPAIISISEEAGLDGLLNRFIFETACEKLSQLNALGFNDIIMSVNLSPRQLNNPGLLELVKNNLTKFNLNPDKVEVELTENVALDQSKELKDILKRLKDTGIRLAIDDFGMGYTSLLYIRTFDVDTIKIDGSLTKDVLTDPNCKEIITAISNLGKTMNIHIIAEVVETKEQRDILFMLGCDIIQGYYYSKPLNYESFVDYLQGNAISKEPPCEF